MIKGSNQMSHLKYVVFDLDGVLIDSFAVMEQAFNFAYRKTVGDGLSRFAEYKKHTGRKLNDILNIMKLPSTMAQLFIEESNRCIDNIKIYDGIVDVLNHLINCGIKMGIATGKDTQRAMDILRYLNINHLFELVLGSDAVERPKPHGQMLTKHVESGDYNAENVLFIGDSTIDLEEGKNAGVMIAAVSWGQGSINELLKYCPDYFFYTPYEIRNIA